VISVTPCKQVKWRDSGMTGKIFRMRWEHIHWDNGLIFKPRGKSRKSRRYVPLTERVRAALLARRRMGVHVEEISVRLYHGSLGFQAVAGSETFSRYSRSGRPTVHAVVSQPTRWRAPET